MRNRLQKLLPHADVLDLIRLEVVALGAAAYAKTVKDEEETLIDHELVDVTLGVESSNGFMVPVLDRFSYIPLKKTLAFSRVGEGNSVRVSVFEGERTKASDNRYLFSLDLLLPKKEVESQSEERHTTEDERIEVTFELDISLRLIVTVRDIVSGATASTTVPHRRLTTQEEWDRFEQMLYEAERDPPGQFDLTLPGDSCLYF